MHIARLPFRLPEGLCRISIGAVFLGHTSTARGAMHVLFDHICAAQLRSTLHTVYSNDVSSSLSPFPAGSKLERRNKYQPFGQAVLCRLGTVSSSII